MTPVVTPSPSNGPSVRVGVLRDEKDLRVMAYGPFDILTSAERVVFTCPGTSVLWFSSVGGQPGTVYYYVVASDYDPKERRQAQYLLGQLRQLLQVGMEVLETTDRMTRPRELAGKGERLLVAVGPFDNLALAEQWKTFLSRAYPAYIVRDTSKRATGEIYLYDGMGRLLARLKDSVLIRMRNASQCIAVDLKPSSANWTSVNRTRPCARGNIEIRLNDSGRLTAIEVVPLEEYVQGVVPAEIGAESPFEALKAQAVAARSEAMFKLRTDRHPGEMFDFCATTHCQVYRGLDGQTRQTIQWVKATAGMVLFSGNDVVDAVYCHSCGGVSADSNDVWHSSKFPYFQQAYDGRMQAHPRLADERSAADWLKARPDVFCNADQPGFPNYAKKYFRWTRRISGEQLKRAANNEKKIGDVVNVQVTDRAESGRVREILVTGTNGSVKISGSYTITGFLNELPSSFFCFEVDHEPNAPHAVRSVTVQGGGFGHGVGMCQMGAASMARRGYPCEQILSKYFPATTIRKLY
jgi:SpoIID/LytB domain protein